MQSRIIWLGVFVGSTIGAFVPDLWGASAFSLSSILWSAIGGIAGVWVGYRISQ